MFNCKSCQTLKAENEHLRKWIDRLMEQKAPDPRDDRAGEIQSRIPQEDLIFQTQGEM